MRKEDTEFASHLQAVVERRFRNDRETRLRDRIPFTSGHRAGR
jgi:hypothetical protein